ncbi:MAG TPA: hypothetical protein VNA04_18240 [Thermoanaerobaculia bacterium]|nr:hypothetical protein [Thermoanaerobaculia bacterium]
MSRQIALILVLIALLAAFGCREPEPDMTVTAPEPAPAEPAPPQPVILSEGFSTPECVIHDAEQDVYFVSNINGAPLAADDNGYISRINAETLEVEARWIDAAAPNIRLNAPKGLVLAGEELWVADINRVVRFDRRTGEPRGAFSVQGATFLNGLAAGDNRVFLSDSGLKAGPDGDFAPTGTDAIWEVTGGKPKRLVRGTDLHRPNGVAVSDGMLWVVGFGAAELYAIEQGKKSRAVTLPAGSLDGLVVLDDGSFLISSWEAKAVYRGPSSGPFEPAVEKVDAPAAIGFDSKRNRVLVPHFMENRVSIHELR